MWDNKERVAKMLSRLAPGDAQKVLAYIADRNMPLSETLKRMMFVFEDVTMLNEKEMQLLHQKIDARDLVLALKGLNESQKEVLLRGLSAKRKELVLSELELTGSVKVSEVKAARQRIADVAREMIESGEISPGEAWIE